LTFVDDHSQDGTYDIAINLSSLLPSANFHHNKNNLGVLKNLYQTLRLVEQEVPQASFFIWVCADDLLDPFFLQITRDHLLRNPKTMLCQTWFSTQNVLTGQTSTHKLQSLQGKKYEDAIKLFSRIQSKEGQTTYNFTLHGLMRFPMMRLLYPNDLKKLTGGVSTELSGLASILSHGSIDIVSEILIHRKYSGQFADKNPQDSLSRYYRNIFLRSAAVLSQFFHMMDTKGGNMSIGLMFLMWLHVLLFYVVAPIYGYIKRLVIYTLFNLFKRS